MHGRIKWSKLDHFQKPSFLLALFAHMKEKNELLVMYSRKPSSKIDNFISSGTGVLTLGWGKKDDVV